MLRIANHGGLLTNASAYAVPPGGAVRQWNLTNSVPGQLTSRGGTRSAQFTALAASRIQTEGRENIAAESEDLLIVNQSPQFRAQAGVITQMFPISGGIGRPDQLLLIDDSGALLIAEGAT